MSLEEARDELHDSTPPGWYVGTYDTTAKAHIGKRSREWTAVHPTQIGVVREMARCLREITDGRVPK